MYEASSDQAPRPDPIPQPAAPPPPPGRTGRPPRRGGGWVSALALLLSLVAVGLSAASLYLTLQTAQREEALEEEQPITFQYGDRTLVAQEGVPVNPYDRAAFTLDDRGRVTYPQARTGVDVSFYQQEIDWQAVAGDGIDFAMIRLGYRGYTEGGLMMDERFEENIRGALDAGLEVGIYFFSQAITPQEAQAEAAFVLNAIRDYEVTYPVAFDWEPITSDHTARTNGLSGDTLTQCALTFCQEIQAAGYTPAVYFNQDLGYLRYDLGELSGQTLWLAEYGTRPDFYYAFDLWQYTHTGQVAGIQGDVDLNLDLRPAGQGSGAASDSQGGQAPAKD